MARLISSEYRSHPVSDDFVVAVAAMLTFTNRNRWYGPKG